ncbi:MAG: tyrosine-type recombinase/integrase [Proteobacteria bacterium]|nr:tyrosine-type recombinase/integrase [Pseudomonadota bacterium]
MAVTWLFGGLRSDEIARMRVGCIRWQSSDAASPEGSTASPCFLDVPVNKTSAAFTKPVDAALGHAVEAWQLDRRSHPKMADRKTGGAVDFLFVFKGRRVSVSYLNRTLIPLLRRKAGVPLEDARGRITSHRARATIASQLVNCEEPLSLLELQKWLGHATPDSTRHYTAVTPTKMAKSLEQAGYFERNLRTIAVLVDSDAIRNGAAARNEPWRYFDLGHGLCTYDFFDQCPHRMACAKCNFYEPKDSARMQAVEAKSNLIRMLQELPLRDEERSAVEDGVKAMDRLTDGLRDIATPDGRTPMQIQPGAFDRDEV